MSPPIVLLIVILLSASLLVLFFLARHSFIDRPEGLQKVFSTRRQFSDRREPHEDLLAALLMCEEKYPRFATLLQTITRAFPLESFLEREEFQRAARELVSLLRRHDLDPAAVRMREKAALATLVRILLDDPEVQLRYGEPLQRLVDDFIEELNASGIDK